MHDEARLLAQALYSQYTGVLINYLREHPEALNHRDFWDVSEQLCQSPSGDHPVLDDVPAGLLEYFTPEFQELLRVDCRRTNAHVPRFVLTVAECRGR